MHQMNFHQYASFPSNRTIHVFSTMTLVPEDMYKHSPSFPSQTKTFCQLHIIFQKSKIIDVCQGQEGEREYGG